MAKKPEEDFLAVENTDAADSQSDLKEALDNMGIPASEQSTAPPRPNERRRWKRFGVHGAYVIVAKASLLKMGKPTYVKLGPIKNIGMKGLAMHYVEKNEKLLRRARSLSIAFPGDGIIVDRIPFKIVNDFEVARLPGMKNNIDNVRHLCVFFERLLPMQKVQLEHFINQYGEDLSGLG
ncbi:MAG: hypothetical protein SWH61_07495 [Thermodesulfobacteriota bacterium]|nr:hypothetical protein [Thermodesulfobacteriota bacterium]